jgi:hypothetical protein
MSAANKRAVSRMKGIYKKSIKQVYTLNHAIVLLVISVKAPPVA